MSLIELARRSRSISREPPKVVTTVAPSFDEAGLSREEWDNFVLDTGGDIYSSYDWCRIWWQHYGRGRTLRLLVFRQGDGLIGLAPMFVETIWRGPLRLRIAKPVGADFAMDVFGFPLKTEWSNPVYQRIISEFIETEMCDAVWFGFVPSQDHSRDAVRAVCGASGGSIALTRDAVAGVQVHFTLPDKFDSYVAALDKSSRQNYRRQLKLLKSNFEVEQTLIDDPAAAATEFDAFCALHTKQWEAEGMPGHFNDWPQSQAFNRDLVMQFAKLGRLRILRLRADGKLAASQYAFRFGSTGYWRLSARTVDKDMARYGLGVLGLMQLLEHMSCEGVERVEGGAGRYEYKIRYGGKETDVLSLLVKSTRPLSSIRVRLFMRVSELVHLIYYRVWRLRIAPDLPFRCGSLWRTWIRHRV
jgi:CelD/BcsL family acetyltransferase involved in cellulose biosynthesis